MKQLRRIGAAAFLAAAPFLYSVQSAQAVTYSFDALTNSVEGDIGEAQFSLDVLTSGGDILFRFINSGPLDSVISEVYFDETADLLDGPVGQDNVGTVSFSSPATPPDLPGGQNISFEATLSADADNPAPTNGVNPGESLGLILSLVGATTFNDVIAAIDAGSLRIGLHAIAFPNGESESFVNNGPTPIPLPASMVLLLAGLGGLGAMGARRKRAAA